MTLAEIDRDLLAAMADGLPLVSRPYAAIGAAIGLGEDEVLARLRALAAAGVISRLGVIVRHHELGFRSNAMTVWDVPDERVQAAGVRLCELSFISLCYRRPRRPPTWRYNLFCMIHGRDRATVMAQVDAATQAAGLADLPRDVLFSVRRFKQRGARYDSPGRPC
jgi:DNA-binding Lrp family transcriptional regulator